MTDKLRWYHYTTIEIRDTDGRVVMVLHQPTTMVEMVRG